MDLNALTKLHYGVYILSSAADGKMSGQTTNSVMQVTSDPVQIAACVSKQNFTYELINKSGKFSISAISQEAPFKFIGNFGFKSGRNINKFENIEHYISNGIPVVTQHATAVFELELVQKIDLGTHEIFIGKVTEMKITDNSQTTMTYEHYHKVKGGLTPKNAPTFGK
ncbi:flavin reductase family protein [Endomicrobium proavitum]|uniref:Putative flavin reductase rutF (Pyrimidine utilization protein F) n=1 Tax=Endomicrobium proavitum TaxID=1408281 RepID=A0A0G3WHU3_9BACT|nr:flavin reductase family protein [Endomicrobium proavitum]AKL97908.1 putative flavin reductase rutF (Pyrimidine utilization protein F) [Endomicrobium proavitum]